MRPACRMGRSLRSAAVGITLLQDTGLALTFVEAWPQAWWALSPDPIGWDVHSDISLTCVPFPSWVSQSHGGASIRIWKKDEWVSPMSPKAFGGYR